MCDPGIGPSDAEQESQRSGQRSDLYNKVMRRTVLLVCAIVFAASAGSGGTARIPVLVELFTSEGCSDCPAADALLQRLVEAQPVAGAEIIALGQHVDYWDRLGWRDRFSSPAFTSRQQLYASRFKTESIYTPQMVVDGRAEFVGSEAGTARRAIERAASTPHGVVRLALEPAAHTNRLVVSASAANLSGNGDDRADLIVAVTEDRLRSDVKRGENHGRVLTHAAVVRHMVIVGEAAAGATAPLRAEIALGADWQRENLKVVAFVQERRTRAILASAVESFASVHR